MAVTGPHGTVTAEKAEWSMPRNRETSQPISLSFRRTMSKWLQTTVGSIGAMGERSICARTRSAMRLAAALKPRRKPKSATTKLVVSADDDVFDQLGVLDR